MAVTASLGRWQLGRAAQKEALQAAQDERARLPALDNAGLSQALADSGASAALGYRAVRLRGAWLPEYTVFLDNRQMQGRPGFFVLTPLRLESGAVLLVQRGWVPRDFQDRTHVPAIAAPQGMQDIAGRIVPPPSRLYEFQSGGEGDKGSSRIRQNLDLAAYRTETGLPLPELSVQQVGAGDDGLLRDWPVPTTGVEKHYGYAFQWFGLCGLIALLYVWFQIVRRLLRPRREPSA